MICPICERDLEIIEKGGNIFEDDPSIVTRYAVCRDCKKQWKLKSATSPHQKKQQAASEGQIKLVGEREQAPTPDLASLLNATKTSSSKKREPEETDPPNPAKSIARGEGEHRPRKKRKGPPPSGENRGRGGQKRTSRDSAERPKSRPQPSTRDQMDRPRDKQRSPSREMDHRPRSQKRPPSHREEREHPARSYPEQPPVLFKPVRMGLAALSILAFLYLSFQSYFTYYLDSAINRGELSSAVAAFLLGLFCLVAGIFLILTLKRDGAIPFIVPSFLYLIGGVIAFFFRGDSRLLLSGAIVALIVAIVLIILILVDRIRNIEED